MPMREANCFLGNTNNGERKTLQAQPSSIKKALGTMSKGFFKNDDSLEFFLALFHQCFKIIDAFYLPIQ